MSKTHKEFETLNFFICVPPQDVTMMHMMYRTSAKARRELAEYLLHPPEDGEEVTMSPQYTSRTAEIFEVMLKSLGLRVDFIDEDQELKYFDDAEINSYSYENHYYMTTEYKFLIIKRILDLKTAILEDNSIIEIDKLVDLIIQVMIDTEYVIGPSESEIRGMRDFIKEIVTL